MRTIDDYIKRRFELWEESKGDMSQDAQYRQSVAYKIVTETNRTLFNDLASNPDKYIELFFVVVDKKRKTVPFKINTVQRMFVNRYKQQLKDYAEGKTNQLRFLILKGRQQGFTTIIEALNLASCMTNKNFAGYVLADNAENTESIFQDKVKHIYDLAPKYIKPSEKISNRREILFQKKDGKGANSNIRVTTAGNEDAGRSKTINFLHISEAGFVDNLDALLTGLEEALVPDAVAFLESTANGYNEFKDLWDNDNNYINLFYEWWLTPEYKLRFINEAQRNTLIKDMEKAPDKTDKGADTREWVFSRCKWLYNVKGLSLEQVHWYFNKWKNKREKIKQEYPCTAKEAFLSSGRPYFNLEELDRRLMSVEPPIRRGYFEYNYKYDKVLEKKLIDDASIQWVDDPNGVVKIYTEPEMRIGYSMGGDTATTGVDANFAQVVDSAYTQYATIEVANDEDLFADMMYCLGKLYNWAMIAPEVNHSTHPTKVLIEREYPNLYMRTNSPDATTEKYSQYNGFRTTSANRRTNLGTLRTLVRERVEAIKDKSTLKQMMSFVIDDNGKPVAEEGKHDDAILAYAIACHVASQQLSEVPPQPEKLKGNYLPVELEDMGYSQWEIERYLEGEDLYIR